ncbi:MAG: phosphatase PAP2 family protein [Desulfomicrobium escambiense]|nr:phosphatase PAP2 family protein [Desulfomicrobium escambiense]
MLYGSRRLPRWSPMLVSFAFLGCCYWALRFVVSTWHGSFNGLNVAVFEERTFGVLPPVWLQEQLGCRGQTRWFDYVFAGLHASFFLIPLLTPLLAWKRGGDTAMRRTVTAFALLTTARLCNLRALAAHPSLDAGPRGAYRTSTAACSAHSNDFMPHFLVGNFSMSPRAAMPSLHAGVPMLMTLVLTRELGFRRSWWTFLILLGISFEILYGGEHYATDVAVGYLFAVVAFLARVRSTKVSNPGDSLLLSRSFPGDGRTACPVSP